jgi:hypothetical protein
LEDIFSKRVEGIPHLDEYQKRYIPIPVNTHLGKYCRKDTSFGFNIAERNNKYISSPLQMYVFIWISKEKLLLKMTMVLS